MKIIRKMLKKVKLKKYIKDNEHVYKDQVNYMFVKKNSNKLLVVFSAFTGDNRRYNYVSHLKNVEMNQLFILDTWGVRGSYYWYEKGKNHPECIVSELINKVIEDNKIEFVISAGTSKGGSAAIYFGLKHKFDEIYSGACQYRVGSYLNRPDHYKIFKSMMGDMDEYVAEALLNNKIKELVMQNDYAGKLNLFYSTKELTYDRQIKPLIDDLNSVGFHYFQEVKNFPNHDDVGLFFPEYLINNIIM